MLTAALSFRAPIVGVANVTADIRESLQVGSASVGVLTGLPVLTFGLAAPAALLVIRRAGPDVALLMCLGGTTAGTLVRSVGGYPAAIAGTLVIGLSITIGNVVVPTLIRQRVPSSATALVTGTYTAAMNVGSMTVTLSTPTLADLLGWRLALAAWALVSAVAAAVWTYAVRPRWASVAVEGIDSAPRDYGSTRRPPWAVGCLLALAFGGQAGAYYGLTSWFPDILRDRAGLSDGAAAHAAAVFQILALAGALSVPLMAARLPRWMLVVVAGAAWTSCPTILLLAPDLYVVACVLGGFAQGAGFTVILVVIVTVSRDARETATISTLVQGLGYCIATLLPIAMGSAFDRSGSWTVPLVLAITATGAFILGCLLTLAQRLEATP